MGYSLEKIKQDLLLTKPTFEQMNLNKISFAQEMEYAIQAFSNNKALLDCDAVTVRNCLVNVALSGLSLSPVMKLSYLVPRKGKCCLDPSYMGLIKIITDTGSVQSIKAKQVYSNEPFEIEQGTGGFVKHGICKTLDKGKRIGAYSIAVLNDGSTHIEWMYEAELMAIKARSKTTSTSTPWTTDEDEMCRKTVVKRHWKYLPKSERAMLASQAIAFDDDINGIDFKKEQEAADKANHNPSATPDAPAEEELATEEDYNELYRLLDSGIGNPFTAPGYEKVSLEKSRTKIEEHQKNNTLLKEKAVVYLSWFNWELEQLPKDNGQESMDDLNVDDETEEEPQEGE